MKKHSFLLSALLFFITANAQTPISIVMSDPVAASNMEFFYQPDPNDEPYTIRTTKDGLQCIEIPSGKFAYFRTINNSVLASDNNLIIKITYFDEGTGNLQFQYNAVNNDNHRNQNIAKTGTNTWITATIALTDASFRKAQHIGYDFRIGAVNYIRQITITKSALDPATEPLVPVTASAYSEFAGKSVAGYQAWFRTGSNGGWFHWSNSNTPSPTNLKFEIYPDISEYGNADLEQTNFAGFPNGQSAQLFNSANTNVINKHFEWLNTYEIDGVAVQRFINGIGSTIDNSPASHLVKIKNAAEANNKIFYICYDISSDGLDATWDDIIKFDWVYNIEQAFALTQSPAYAKVGNKPVVQIWGTGFTGNHPGTEQETIALIQFLQNRGCYVIGGVPTWWRTQTGDSKPNFINAYNAYDMLSPWLVGRFGDNAGANSMLTNPMQGDKAYCDSHNIDYMPVLFPGFAWSQWNGSSTGTSGTVNEAPRNAGEFMWQQAKNIKSLNIPQMYFAMFDEYDEGTAIMKAATDWSEIPANQYFLTTSADGYWLSSDFQLRTAGAAIKMLKGTLPVTENVPVPHSNGPVFYRNNFESRTTSYNYYDGQYHNSGTFPLDPCFKNPAQISLSNVNNQNTVILQIANAKTGNYVARINGNATANNGTYYYKFADVKIAVVADMTVSFSKYPINAQGVYANVGLQFSDGTTHYNLSSGQGSVNSWSDYSFTLDNFIGKTVTGIVLGYNGNASGNFDAYFDNFLIKKEQGTTTPTPNYPVGYPKTIEMTNPLFWQFPSEKVNAAGELTGETGNLYTADASAHVWNINGVPTLFVYASHDMELPAGCDRMDRYHVFSTTDMQTWTDYGEILNASQVPWHNGIFQNNSKFMWAPDCAYKNGKYYFYFPHPSQNSNDGAGSWGNNWKIGIAVSDFPASDFTILPNTLGGLPVAGEIDPCVFVDDNQQAYFYYGGGGRCYGGRLKDNMIELDGNLQEMQGLVDFHEATWIHKHNGKYYLSYSDNHGSDGNQMRYATSNSPLGPWESKGVYIYATGVDTDHGSIVKFNNQWYAFYHTDYVSNQHNLRSVQFAPLFHNADGTIQVVNTWGEPFGNNGQPRNVIAVNNTETIALTLQAEDFNETDAFGYHDIDNTIRHNYRTVKGVMIENRNGGYNLGELAQKEFYRYSINAAQAGLYDIDCYVASENSNGRFHISVNGTNKSGTIAVNATGGWGDNNTFIKQTVKNIPLKEGFQYIDFRIENGGFNIDKFEFRKSAPYSGTPFNGPHNVPGKVEAEDFDNGGQGVAYYDSSVANEGGSNYRTGESVDLQTENGQTHISHTNGGEWVKYTLNVTESGIYRVTIRVSTGNGAQGSLQLVFDDVDEYPIVQAQTASWTTFGEVVLNNVTLTQSTHIMQMVVGGNINIDWYDFVKTADIPSGTAQVEEDEITFYPNPTTNFIYLKNASENADIEIFDILGKKILHTKDTKIDFSRFSAGIYFIKINNKTLKVIKK